MDFEFVVKDEAKKFLRYKSWAGTLDYASKMKDALELQLYNHQDPAAKLIFLYEVRNHFKDEYQKHLQMCKHKSDPMQCTENVNFTKCIYYTEQLVKELNPHFDFTILRPEINAELIRTNIVSLGDFPECGKFYQSAIDKLKEGRMERNLLDDLRLTYELLLKGILSNDKPLEKQSSDLGSFLKSSGISTECRNMIITLTDYFAKHQNANVKHSEGAAIAEGEVNFVFNITSTIINLLLSVKHDPSTK
jgi:hypothetical protein